MTRKSLKLFQVGACNLEDAELALTLVSWSQMEVQGVVECECKNNRKESRDKRVMKKKARKNINISAECLYR